MKKLIIPLTLLLSAIAGIVHAQAKLPTNLHMHPAVTGSSTLSETKKRNPGFCEIELVQNSIDAVTVYGTFDDGAAMTPFAFYPGQPNQYISLYYPDPYDNRPYCHAGMYLSIYRQIDNAGIFMGYVTTGQTVNIVTYKRNTAETLVSIQNKISR